MSIRKRTFIQSAAGAAALTIGSTALAQAPEGLMTQEAASSGSTDVATEGFEAPSAKPDEEKDSTTAKITAGGLLATGNSRSLSLTGAGDFKLRRGPNQFSAAAGANFARAAATPADDTETTVENYQGKIRYDRFLSGALAAFLAVSGRRDRFQGLDLRLNIDPGLAYYFVDVENHQLWAEGGYDLQYDVRRDENIAAAAADGTTVEKTETRHSARLFAGYDNKLNAAVTFSTGLEYLQSVEASEDWRLNWDVGLTSAIADRFSVATTFSLKYDNNPLPGVEELDTITAFNLVYTLL